MSLTLTAEHAMNCAKTQALWTIILNCMWNSCTIKIFSAPVKIDKKKMENEIKWPTVSRNKIYIKDNLYLKQALNSQPLDYEASMLPIELNTQLKSCNIMS